MLAQAAGNPLALIELATVIADDPAASRRWAAEPLPLTDRLSAVITARFAALPSLRKMVGSPIEEPSLWRIASAAWLMDESDLAITLLEDAMRRLRAPGMRGTSGGSLTVLGWAYIDTGRWDEARRCSSAADTRPPPRVARRRPKP